jgi:PIN domain nuclease of toxin-antitoxin system
MLWWDAGTLPAATVKLIQDADEVYVSAASAWEVAIKEAIGKLRASATVSAVARAYGFRELPILFAHAERVRTLPAVHRDPFDRMLCAQAFVEGLTIVTRDRVFSRYRASVAWR